MIRKLIARSIVIAGFAAIIGAFWHEYGVEGLGIAEPVSFPAEQQQKKITDKFKPGPRATVHRVVAVDLDSAGVRALQFSPFNPDTRTEARHKVYIDDVEVAEDTVVTAGKLRVFIKKAGNSTYGEFPYGLMLTDRKLVDHEQILLSDSETLVRAVWTEEKEGLWSLQVKGAPASTAKVFIMASEMLPVLSKSSSALALSQNPALQKLEPIPMVVYQDGRTPRGICLNFMLANEGYHVLPSRSNRFPLAELDLGGDGEKILMKFDVGEFKKLERSGRVNDSCSNPKATWPNLPDREKLLEWYRGRRLESLETILWAQHETR